MAILGAETAFGIHEHVDLHALAEIVTTHFENGGQKLRQLLVRCVQDRLHLFAIGYGALKSFIRKIVKIHIYPSPSAVNVFLSR